MITNYLLITFRSIMKNKVPVFINVLGLGIAIACCIVAYLNLDFNRRFDHNHVNAGNIYRIQAWHHYQDQHSRYAVVPHALGGMVKQNINDVDEVVRYTTAGTNIRIGDEVFSTTVAYADPAFFDFFTFELKAGSFTSFRDKSHIFISDELARKYFNTEDVVGRQLTRIDKGILREFVVGGVFRQQPLNSSFACEAITLWDNFFDETGLPDTDWKGMSTVFIRIKDPSRTDAVTRQLQTYVAPQNLAREDLKLTSYYLQNFRTLAASFHGDTWLNGEQLRWGFPPSIIMGPGLMAIFLLLLACFNFTNTTVALSGRRLKEIGVRKTMGGARRQLIFQFLGESMVLCFLALVTGLLLAEVLAPAYSSLWPNLKLTIRYTENLSFFFFLALMLLFTALVAGMYPAFYITSFKPIAILKGKLRFGGTNWFTRTLLTFQFSIALVCIVLGIGFIRNAAYQRDYSLGYAKQGVIVANVAGAQEFKAFRNALAENKDVIAIGGSKDHVSDRYYKGPVKYEGTEHQVEVVDIGDGYLEAMNITLLEGRGFRQDSETDIRESVLVSETFVKQFGWTGSALGKRLLWKDSVQLYVVGVVNDILTDGFWKPAGPVMLRYVAPEQYTQIVVSTSAEKISVIDDLMKAEWKKISLNTLYNGKYTDGNMWVSEMINNNAVRIFSFLGLMAVLMSATALFALVSLNILKKMKEIGVRKVLGAPAANIARVINQEFIIILSVASLLGGAAGYVMTDKLMDAVWEYYLRVELPALAAAILSLFGVAVITVGYKTLTTVFMNPVHTLRDE